MADVKWIRLSIDMFSNAKIKYLRTLPEGNNIILIWVMLLTIGGRCNSNGFIFLTENIPYTTKILADELGFDESVIILSLNALSKLNMIQQIDDLISITGWDEHQNSLGLEKIREQNRIRKQRQRESEKKLISCHVTCHANVTQSHATELEKEEDKEIDIKDIPEDKSSSRTQKNKYGEYKHVLLKPEELQKLQEQYGMNLSDQAITFLDEYIEMKGYKAKSHYLAIRKWVIDAVKEQANKKQPQQPKPNKFNQFPQRTYTDQAMNELERKLLNKGL